MSYNNTRPWAKDSLVEAVTVSGDKVQIRINSLSLWDIARHITAEAMAKMVMDFCNNSHSSDAEDVVEVVTTSHRTLQQIYYRLFIQPVIVRFAKFADEGCTDPRNEVACRQAQTALRAIKADCESWEYIPFV